MLCLIPLRSLYSFDRAPGESFLILYRSCVSTLSAAAENTLAFSTTSLPKASSIFFITLGVSLSTTWLALVIVSMCMDEF